MVRAIFLTATKGFSFSVTVIQPFYYLIGNVERAVGEENVVANLGEDKIVPFYAVVLLDIIID